eukprot:scaffold79884_cov17-Tisochrysis_lutea.AAC.4
MPPAHQPGMSPALQAGLATTQPKSNIPAARGLSPALRAGLSPALQQGLASTTATAAAPPQPPLQQVQPPTPTSAPPPQQPQQNAQQLYFAGAAQLEAGNWGSAEGTFTRALEQLAQQPSGSHTHAHLDTPIGALYACTKAALLSSHSLEAASHISEGNTYMLTRIAWHVYGAFSIGYMPNMEYMYGIGQPCLVLT